MTVGLRYDKLSELEGGLTPRGAIIYHPTKNTTIKGLYGQAFRNPNVYERKIGDGYELLPNIDLKREQVETMEIVFEQKITRNFHGSLNLFSNKVKDLIDKVTIEEDVLEYQNVSEISAMGLEAELRWNAAKIKGYASYSFQKSKYKDNEDKLTNSPVHLVKSGINFPITKYLTLGIENYFESNRLTVYDTFSDPFWISNINLNIDPFLNSNSDFLKGINLAAKVNNVFGATYGLPGGFEHIQNLINQNGRNYSLRLSFKF